jgi:hypothetical protein
MSLQTQYIRIAGKQYTLKLSSETDGSTTVRCEQFPGIVSTSPDQGMAVSRAYRAVIDKIIEQNPKAKSEMNTNT